MLFRSFAKSFFAAPDGRILPLNRSFAGSTALPKNRSNEELAVRKNEVSKFPLLNSESKKTSSDQQGETTETIKG